MTDIDNIIETNTCDTLSQTIVHDHDHDEKESTLTKSREYIFPKSQGYCHQKYDTCASNRFKNKTLLITGGGGNFGSVCAQRFAKEGGNVIIWDLFDASEIVELIKKKYPSIQIASYIVDVTDEDLVEEMSNKCWNDFNCNIDYLFNNAGYQGQFTPTHNYSVKDFRKVMDINVTGMFIVLKYISKLMMKQQQNINVNINSMARNSEQLQRYSSSYTGYSSSYSYSIVNTSSAAGTNTPANMIGYATSKAAVLHMTKIASKDLAPYNIRVNSITPAIIGPGKMWTNQIESQANANSIYFPKDYQTVANKFVNAMPMKRYGSIDEVIACVLFLFSDDASYLTGVDLPITGGPM